MALHRNAIARLLCMLLLVAPGATFAAGASPEETLRDKGLSRVGIYYVVDTDAKLPELLRALRKAEQQLEQYARKRREAERDIQNAKDTILRLHRESDDIQARMAQTPKSDQRKYNELVRQMNARGTSIEEGHQYIEKIAAYLQKLVAPNDHVTLALDLANKMDAAVARYEALAKDDEVTAALRALNEKAGAKYRLGPGAQFKSELPQMQRRRETLNADALKLDMSDGGVGRVNVSLNGAASVPMVLDSGAAYVVITAKVAEAIGLEIPADAPVAQLRIADGSLVEAKGVMLATVRIGRFTATDVACVVMPASDKEMHCLLGGTFLRQFIYRIDLSAGELHLSPITAKTAKVGEEEPVDPPPAAAPPPKKEDDVRAATTPTVLEVAADIDGSDQLDISASGLMWTHHTWGWPPNVSVNGIAWDPRKPLAAADKLKFLENVDWRRSRVVEKAGRGNIAIESRANGIRITFVDEANGAASYKIKIALTMKKPGQ